jgi:hypothetical protein
MRRFWLALSFFLALVPPVVQADVVCDGTDDRMTSASLTNVPTTPPFAVTVIVRFASVPGPEQGFTSIGQAGAPAAGYSLILNQSLIATKNLVTGNEPFNLVTIPPNKWLFMAWAAGSTTSHRFYIWNYEDRTTVLDVTSATTLGTLTIPSGGTATVKVCAAETSAGAFATFFNATVRQVAYYNKDWTASSDPFRAMAYLGPHAVATPTVLYNFQGVGTSTTVREQQGSANTGTLTNFSATPWIGMNYPRPFWVQ